MVRAVMKEPLNWEDDEAFVAERADHLSLQTIATSTAIDGPTSNIVAKLLENGTKLLVGPRGCGKTHLMRYAFVKSAMEKNAPFCVYISFNRSYRLEPLLRNRTNALDVFHRWVICLCYLGLHDAVDKYCERLAADDTAQLNEEIWVDYKRDELTNIISRFEHGGVLAEEQRGIYDELSVDRLKENVIAVAESFSRSRSVLLLDDAALTLTPEYLPEFLMLSAYFERQRLPPRCLFIRVRPNMVRGFTPCTNQSQLMRGSLLRVLNTANLWTQLVRNDSPVTRTLTQTSENY